VLNDNRDSEVMTNARTQIPHSRTPRTEKLQIQQHAKRNTTIECGNVAVARFKVGSPSERVATGNQVVPIDRRLGPESVPEPEPSHTDGCSHVIYLCRRHRNKFGPMATTTWCLPDPVFAPLRSPARPLSTRSLVSTLIKCLVCRALVVLIGTKTTFLQIPDTRR
jgi:hypothetical protein